MSDINTVQEQLKLLIVKSLKLEDVDPGEMSDNQNLIDGEFEIDSIDILQLIVDIERKFGIKLVKGKFDREVWKNLSSLAATIETLVNEG